LTVAALACAAVVAFAPVNASATPVLWNLNATITGGTASGTAVGSFVYDADTNLYSSVAITTTLPAASFSTNEIFAAFYPVSNMSLQLIDNFVPGANVGNPTIAMLYTAALTNGGGSLGLESGASFAGLCAVANCNAILFTSSGVTVGGFVSGQLTGTPVVSTVPEPATLVLCSAGLIGAGVRRWRQRRA
jgi:hypothetical protein